MSDKPVDNDFLSDEVAEQVIVNGHLLSALYGQHAPPLVKSGENWEAFALACLARSHYTLQTILSIPTRDVDAAVLARSLYEHVVTFAWLLIDPPLNFRRLQAWEHPERRKMVTDPHAFELIERPSVNVLDQALPDRDKKSAPETPERAEEADRYWSRCNIPWRWHMRHGYASLFRVYSSYVHPTLAGVDPFITPGQPPRVGLPRQVPQHLMIRVEAVKCFADALAVSSHRLGWPDIAMVNRAFANGLVPSAVKDRSSHGRSENDG